jgi:dihydropteroate synthase
VLRQTQYGGPPPTLLLGVGADPQQAARARAEGADLIDARGATRGALAAIRASLPAGVLWTDQRADPLDADRLAARAGTARRATADTAGQAAADTAGQAAVIATGRATADTAGQAAVIATAAVCTWLGAPVVRSRHTRAVRRSIDMTASIAGHRPPSRTVRGLA